MVSKLLLATQELFHKAINNSEKTKTIKDLGYLYYKIRSGLSSDKTPQKYGAFPYDPYSHTPYQRGAQQPGMTGQVKEEIITRMGELGCVIKKGKLIFNPKLLKKSEFLDKPATFTCFDTNQNLCDVGLKKNQLAFTYCQVPVVYELIDKKQGIIISFNDNKIEESFDRHLSANISKELFSRTKRIKKIHVFFKSSEFLF